jgi:hypothetical protein
MNRRIRATIKHPGKPRRNNPSPRSRRNNPSPRQRLRQNLANPPLLDSLVIHATKISATPIKYTQLYKVQGVAQSYAQNFVQLVAQHSTLILQGKETITAAGMIRIV